LQLCCRVFVCGRCGRLDEGEEITAFSHCNISHMLYCSISHTPPATTTTSTYPYCNNNLLQQQRSLPYYNIRYTPIATPIYCNNNDPSLLQHQSYTNCLRIAFVRTQALNVDLAPIDLVSSTLGIAARGMRAMVGSLCALHDTVVGVVVVVVVVVAVVVVVGAAHVCVHVNVCMYVCMVLVQRMYVCM